jgi:hypothetical protein
MLHGLLGTLQFLLILGRAEEPLVVERAIGSGRLPLPEGGPSWWKLLRWASAPDLLLLQGPLGGELLALGLSSG